MKKDIEDIKADIDKEAAPENMSKSAALDYYEELMGHCEMMANAVREEMG